MLKIIRNIPTREVHLVPSTPLNGRSGGGGWQLNVGRVVKVTIAQPGVKNQTELAGFLSNTENSKKRFVFPTFKLEHAPIRQLFEKNAVSSRVP